MPVKDSCGRWFYWAVFVCGVVPHVVYWGGGAGFGVVALVRLAQGEAAPPSESIMQTHENWPPIILPSWPFWVVAPVLITGVIRTLRSRRGSGVTSVPPWLVSSFALFAGADALLMAIAYVETPEWPRDSFVPGAVLTLSGLIGLAAVALRLSMARTGIRRGTRASLVDSSDGEATP